MNIIFYRYNSVCEPDFIESFKKVGITVLEDDDGLRSNLDVESKMLRLGNMIADHRPLFVFSINFFPFVSMLCNRLKVKYVAESVDCPVFELYDKSILGEFNRIFLFDYLQYESLKDFNPHGIYYLPLGAPSDRTKKLLGDHSDYKYDVSFVGSLYKEKDPLLNVVLPEGEKEKLGKLIDKQIEESPCGLKTIEKVITYEDIDMIKTADKKYYSSDRSVMNLDRFVAINDYISPHMAYLERVKMLNAISEQANGVIHLFTRSDTSDLSKRVQIHGGVSTLKEMPFVFRQSKININCTMRSIQTGIPQRIWDVLACKGFLLTNNQPEIHEYFRVGEHLETYDSQEEMIEKINYYLDHEEERQRIAEAGYEEVANKHDILQRIISIITIISKE